MRLKGVFKTAKYMCLITSCSSWERKYEVKTKSAMKCAEEYGRCEWGERVRVYAPSTGRVISEVRYAKEWGGYYRTCVDNEYIDD